MKFLFKPKEIIERYDKFIPEKYKELGYEMVLLDIDNTIAIPDSGELTPEAKDFINHIKNLGMRVVILSNNTKERVSSFVGDNDIDFIYKAYKPLPFKYLMACKKFDVKPSRTIMIGDQLITDILGANLSGIYGIYTKKLVDIDIPVTARNRKIENFIWRHILHEEV